MPLPDFLQWLHGHHGPGPPSPDPPAIESQVGINVFSIRMMFVEVAREERKERRGGRRWGGVGRGLNSRKFEIG